jgi:hypothetical protein
MALTYSNNVNAAKLDAIETTIGVSPKLKLYGGTVPTDVTVALTGQTLLFDNALAQDTSAPVGNWLAPAVAARPATISKNGAWTGQAGAGAGAGVKATFFRITTSADAASIQGSCGIGGSFDLKFDNDTLANGQTVTVTAFQISSAN